MKIKIISYSYTGNNETLAANLAKEINAKHLRIIEPKKRTAGKIVRENVFNRDPKINLSGVEISAEDFVIFVGPFWFGKIASPLRAYFKQLKRIPSKYGFLSLCVGYDDPVGYQKFKNELGQMLGRAPEFVILKRIADLFPSGQAPTQKMLTEYRINQQDLKLLVASIKEELGDTPPWS
jgi:flavodoxin